MRRPLFTRAAVSRHIRLKRYPMLPEEPPHERERLQAKHVMATSIKSVCDVERVGKIIDLLNTTTHHGFPVIASSQLQRARPADGNQGTPFQRKPRVLGIVLREQLVTILAKLKAHNWRAPSPGPDPHALAADDFLRPWFNEAVSADSVRMSADELERRIDLRPYINEAAVVTAQNSSLRRVSALFRSLGLRHLLVVESCPTIVGVVTRKDLLMGGEEFLLPGGDCWRDDEAEEDVPALHRAPASSPARLWHSALSRITSSRRSTQPRGTRLANAALDARLDERVADEAGLQPLSASALRPIASSGSSEGSGRAGGGSDGNGGVAAPPSE